MHFKFSAVRSLIEQIFKEHQATIVRAAVSVVAKRTYVNVISLAYNGHMISIVISDLECTSSDESGVWKQFQVTMKLEPQEEFIGEGLLSLEQSGLETNIEMLSAVSQPSGTPEA